MLFARPPLADELFLADYFFADCLSLYPRGKPIVPYLQQPQEQGAHLSMFWRGFRRKAIAIQSENAKSPRYAFICTT
jgi:hypothetical protein